MTYTAKDLIAFYNNCCGLEAKTVLDIENLALFYLKCHYAEGTQFKNVFTEACLTEVHKALL